MFYVEDSQIKSYLGVDVSVHQDDIDWNEVKRAGIDFAMIRLGFRGYGTGEAQLDDNYRQNIDGARAAGLDAGVYFFSQAVTVDEALEEAQIVIDSLDGLDVNYPVVYDWEIIYDDTPGTDDVPVDVLIRLLRSLLRGDQGRRIYAYDLSEQENDNVQARS